MNISVIQNKYEQLELKLTPVASLFVFLVGFAFVVLCDTNVVDASRPTGVYRESDGDARRCPHSR